MQNNKTGHLTYKENVEIARWLYVINTPPPDFDLINDKERSRWIARLTSRILNTFSDFANVGVIDVSTDSKGEESFRVSSPTVDDIHRLDAFLRETPDVSEIDIWLDLLCITPADNGELSNLILYKNSYLFISNNLAAYGAKGIEHGIIDVDFGVDTNIYSPVTHSNNRQLAELNGPRLTSFLHRLEEDVPLVFQLVDPQRRGGEYELAYRYGFKLPNE